MRTHSALVGALAFGAVLGSAVALTTCSPEPTLAARDLSVSVNYNQPFVDALAEANITPLEEGIIVPSESLVGVRERRVSVVSTANREAFPSLRSATPLELVAFAREHPQEAARFRGLCARGSFVESSEGYRGHLVYSGAQNGRSARIGVWRNGCRWALLVAGERG